MATVPGRSNVIPMMPEWAKPTQADFLQAVAIMHENDERAATARRSDPMGDKPFVDPKEVEQEGLPFRRSPQQMRDRYDPNRPTMED